SALPEHEQRIARLVKIHRVPIIKIGNTGGTNLKINELIDLPVDKLNKIYEDAIPRLMEHVAAVESIKR
ncbi:MAG TPA: hypothetical protein DEO84_10165, partial [candidate division Zixibacteria bacterium]|nr:hypothetical protein [candidate division Zixibacteria bacterium]